MKIANVFIVFGMDVFDLIKQLEQSVDTVYPVSFLDELF